MKIQKPANQVDTGSAVLVEIAENNYFSHFMEKSPSIRGFGLLLERLLSYRLPSSKYVKEAKEQYKIFVKDV